MRWISIFLILLAGCAGPAAEPIPEDEVEPSPEPTKNADPRQLEPTSDEGTEIRVVLDHDWNHANLGELPILGEEFVIGTVEIPEGATDMWVNVTRSSTNVRAFADNLRAYAPDGSLADQDAFSDQQYANLFAEGTAGLLIKNPGRGEWTIRHTTDHIYQAEEFEGNTLVTIRV